MDMDGAYIMMAFLFTYKLSSLKRMIKNHAHTYTPRTIYHVFYLQVSNQILKCSKLFIPLDKASLSPNAN